MRSFAEPDTEFRLERSGTPPTVDGLAIDEPTGEVTCVYCEATHENVDEIPHDPGCPQRFVHSEWYADSMDED